MPMQPGFRIAAIGELLWDLLPDGLRLGGAPANFAASMAKIAAGSSSTIFLVSRVGDDALGRQAREQMAAHGVAVDPISTDPRLPTGTVAVTLDSVEGPSYSIHRPAAWDAIPSTPELSALATGLDAVCFGTLAQRAAVTRETLRGFVEATGADCVRVFDVNLRPPYWTPEALRWGCERATIVKMNQEEVPLLAEVLAAPLRAPAELADFLLGKFPVKMVAVTRAANGSLLTTRTGVHHHPGIAIDVVDPVGAGDAFTAALVHAWLCGDPLAAIAEQANRWGARVAAQRGGDAGCGDE